MNEKNSLIDELDSLPQDHHKQGLGTKPLIMVMIGLLFILALTIPKIYLSNNIYFKSRNIYNLQYELDALKEENKVLKRGLEDIKFKYLTTEIDF